jgi:uncharacterized membrane protein YraQ (UPF0718 family)
MKKILSQDQWFIIYLIIAIIVSIIISYILRKLHIKRRKSLTRLLLENYDAPYLSQGASSVDSEKQFASTGNQWKGQPNKCYSCERDMQMRCGDQCAYQATKTKCFDC